jgi:hypothetical protein
MFDVYKGLGQEIGASYGAEVANAMDCLEGEGVISTNGSNINYLID